MNFPTIANPSYPLSEEYEDTSIVSNFEDGTQQARTAKTRSRCKWTLTWNSLSQNDYNTLMSFVKNSAKFCAVDFNWTHPLTNVVHQVRIAETPTDWQTDVLNYWHGSIRLVEV